MMTTWGSVCVWLMRPMLSARYKLLAFYMHPDYASFLASISLPTTYAGFGFGEAVHSMRWSCDCL
eukprot:1855741-Amphidinium_carterae.2